jgi:hypothetical protein
MPEEFELPVLAVSLVPCFDVCCLWLKGVLETAFAKERVVSGKSWTFWADFDGLRTHRRPSIDPVLGTVLWT